jgi:hypothetical protein
VDTVLSALPPGALRLSSPVHSVRTLESGKVLLTTVGGKSEEYDHVVMACHADASLAILRAGGGVTNEEESILGGFQWNKNVAVIHSDPKVSLFSFLSLITMKNRPLHPAHAQEPKRVVKLELPRAIVCGRHGCAPRSLRLGLLVSSLPQMG